MKYHICFIFILVVGILCQESPKVKTKNGEIRGFLKTSYKGKKYSAFEGVPYAKPPIGEQRFEEPQPAESWKGTWDATISYQCIQIFQKQEIIGQEDCLYINVYVPRENPDPKDNLEVIVHIHGGAFMLGHGNLWCDSEILMDHDVIFITLNYSLGILGFLSTEDETLPGNLGMKDQTLALKWVQDNIASFGGNPKSVTITGMSAGGASVHFHILSPLSAGLFQRAHSQSGSALNPWVLQEQPLEKAKKLASLLGCEHDTSQKLLGCLKTRPAKQLLSKLSEFCYSGNLPISPFAPTIDNAAKNPFLPKHPLNILREKKFNNVPWLTCSVPDEGQLMTLFLPKDMKDIEKRWTEMAPHLLEYNYTVTKSKHEEVANEIKKYYIGGEITKKTFKKFIQISTDRLFTNGIELAAKKQAEANKSPVYYYLFNYESKTFKDPLNLDGIPHGVSGNYIYGNPFEQNVSSTDKEMIEVIVNMLISFARTGIPKIKDVKWEPTGSSELTYLNITSPTDIKLQTVKELTPKSFWRSLGIMENENLVDL